MEKTNKKKKKFSKNIIIGIVLIFISTNKMFNYMKFSIPTGVFGLILILTGLLMLIPIIFPNLFKKFKKDEEEQDKPKPKVYFYSKPKLVTDEKEIEELTKKNKKEKIN